MATATSFSFPNFKYGFLPEYFKDDSPPQNNTPPSPRRSFSLRPGQWVAIVPRLANVENIFYEAGGLSHLISNTGDLDTSIDVSKRAGMDSGEFVINPLEWNAIGWNGRTSPAVWTEISINNEVNSHLSPLGGKLSFFVDQIGEKLSTLYDANLGQSNGFGIAEWNESSQQRDWAKAVAAIVQDPMRAGRFYGGYDGHLNLRLGLYTGRVATGIAAALANPEAAYNFVTSTNATAENGSQYSAFRNDFYSATAKMYEHRHGCIKIYQTGDTNMHRFVSGSLMDFYIDRLARRHIREVLSPAYNRRCAVIAFSGYMETLDSNKRWSVRYTRTEPGRGTVARTTFPQWSYSLQLFLYTVALLWDFDLYSWESEERFGDDSTVIDRFYGTYIEDGVRKGIPPEISANDTFTQATTVRRYSPNQAVSYPLNPQGGQDIVPVAAELATWLKEWVGNWDTEFAAHRVIGDPVFTTLGSTYLADRFDRREGICLLGTDRAYRRWVLFCDTALQPGQTEVVEVNLGGFDTFTFTAYGQTCHAFRISDAVFVD